MLRIIDLKKDYAVADGAVHALKGISVNFRKSEFVSILGPSGCGKTTLLNIIGGLDKYTSGDLQIEGKSTKTYSDRDWDTYRNHSIGFIFQSYHLIPHQTILQNVELALMIGGISKKERRQRAIEALDKVGLKDKINNKPNQLSGGQAQRVAIARALINDPEIVLADEPTGALDSVTSVQIMDLLKEIAKDRLVIMVTHNPELAEQYSTRIVRLKDGEVVGDTHPYSDYEEEAERDEQLEIKGLDAALSKKDKKKNKPANGKKVNKGKKHSAMSIGMAFGLSFKNLLSKRKRTTMVSFAGSIGIIGVSMVLAISAGVHGYIDNMENDLLSGYPVSVTQSAYDFTSLMELSQPKVDVNLKELASGNKVYVNSLLDTLGTFSTGFQKTNHITEAYIDYVSKVPAEHLNLIQYDYGFTIANNIYTDFTVSDNLADHLEGGDASGYTNEYNMSVTAIRAMYSNVLSKVPEYSTWGSMISSVSTFAEMPDNYEYITSQYDIIAADKDGKPVTEGLTDEELKELFTSKDTLIMVVSGYHIDDLTLAQYGYFTEDEFLDYAYKGIDETGENQDTHLIGEDGLPYSFFIGDTAKKFTYYPNDCVYTPTSYIPDPQYSDTTLRSDRIANYLGIDYSTWLELANAIIYARSNDGDDGLRRLYSFSPEIQEMGIGEEAFVEMFHLPTEENRICDGYIANAYSTEYTYDKGTPIDTSDDINLSAFSTKEGYDKKVDLGVKLILQKKESVSYGCLDTGFYYTKALTDYILETEKDSEIVASINGGAELSEVPMYVDYYYVSGDYYVLDTAKSSIETGGTMMSQMIGQMTGTSSTEYLTANNFGGSSLPVGMYIYPTDFNSKNSVCAYLDGWNDMCTKEGTEYTYTDFNGEEQTVTLFEKDRIDYNDTVGLIINMVNTMIDMITIALIVFTALSLVVSTVMIGIITYVSVVERVKEIGILRAVGARKKDIKRLFNAETFIIGLTAGIFGILITYVLSLITNIIVSALAGFWGIAALPWWQALIMIGLSVFLTLISGLIPASAAAKKDPVVALRTE
ncbi:MAG: ATP-binding cassette domain-containing protein [Candidatus Coproplasma sp.]